MRNHDYNFTLPLCVRFPPNFHLERMNCITVKDEQIPWTMRQPIIDSDKYT